MSIFQKEARPGLELAEESADSTIESDVSTTNSVIVSQLPLLNMFNILNPVGSANRNRLTIAGGRQQIGLVGMGLKD